MRRAPFGCSTYLHPDLSPATRGGGATGTGLIWCAFRPSDDPTEEPFNIPQEMFAAAALRKLATIARVGYGDAGLAASAVALSSRIQLAIERYGRFYDFRFGWIYVYETDGRDHVRLMDDANIPDLLAAPLYGYVSTYDQTYVNRRRFALSGANPYYYRGHVVSGTGSPQTPKAWVWPLAIATRAMTPKTARKSPSNSRCSHRPPSPRASFRRASTRTIRRSSPVQNSAGRMLATRTCCSGRVVPLEHRSSRRSFATASSRCICRCSLRDWSL